MATGHGEGTLITVAPTGGELAKADVPALPTTLEELVATAKACQAAGAGMIHVHLRDAQDRSCLDPLRLREAVEALQQETDLVVQLSTGGAIGDSFADRIAVLDAAPDSCSITCGTVNFGDEVFANPWALITLLHAECRDRGIVPEYELFDLGHAATLQRLLDEHGAPATGRVHADLVMGVPGGMPGTTAAVVAVAAALPVGATWSATGVGRSALPVALAALSAGGHLRVGLEDTVTYAKGRPVRDNAELVERAAALAELAQRPALNPAEARAFLGL
ncbi:MAG: 3-keto-5-aminohexanoate cleavage protein [Sporichthyaceae bacterium]